MALTREEMLGMDDLTFKEVTIPEGIAGWRGRTIYIRQLTRGEQDAYVKRQFADARMRTQKRDVGGDIPMAGIFGHDAWLCVRGVCDESGKPIFTDKDIAALNAKSGEAIGWIAKEIVTFSGMGEDVSVASGEKTEAQALEEELKN
jgi:hypothetical protein